MFKLLAKTSTEYAVRYSMTSLKKFTKKINILFTDDMSAASLGATLTLFAAFLFQKQKFIENWLK